MAHISEEGGLNLTVSKSSDFGSRTGASSRATPRSEQSDCATSIASKTSPASCPPPNRSITQASFPTKVADAKTANHADNVEGFLAERTGKIHNNNRNAFTLSKEKMGLRLSRLLDSDSEKLAVPYNTCQDECTKTKRSTSPPAHSHRPFSEEPIRAIGNAECRFNRDGKVSKAVCKHFPCSTPITYHALGFRRDDISTWCPRRTQNDNNEAVELCLESCEASGLLDTPNKENNVNTYTKEKPERRAINLSHVNKNIEKHEPKCEDPEVLDQTDIALTSFTPQWMGYKQPKNFSFRPASGPAFGPKPRDPILERVRQGSTQVLPSDKQPARMTVAGRMRGLRSLILEMREKHENAKPVDWAVNYGQRLPMRVLLNPVLPVAL